MGAVRLEVHAVVQDQKRGRPQYVDGITSDSEKRRWRWRNFYFYGG